MGASPQNIVIMNNAGGGSPPPQQVMMSPMGYPPQGGYMVSPNGTMVPAGNPQVGYAPQGYAMASPHTGYQTPPNYGPPAGVPMHTGTGTDQPPSTFNYNQQGGGPEGYSTGYTQGGPSSA